MANPYIPTNLRVDRFLNDRAVIKWDFPQPASVMSYKFKVYASLTNSPPFAGPAIESGLPRAEAEIRSIAGTTNFYVTVSSLNINTNEESSQSSSLFVSIDHSADGVGGAIAKSPTNIPKYIKTSESGELAISILPGSGIATEEKQDDQIALLDSINGALGGSVADPFFEFWDANVLPNVPTEVANVLVPGFPATLSFFLTGLYVTGQGPCLVELKLGMTKKWSGRTGDVNTDLNALFTGSGLKASPGEHLTITLTQGHTTSLQFSGNLFGFRK